MMRGKTYKQLRGGVAFFVSLIVGLAVVRGSYLLAVVGILTGMVVTGMARTKAKMRTDERELSIQEKAARFTYAIFAPILGITAFFMLLPTKGGMSVFSKGEWLYIESIGMIFAYLTLFLIALYAFAYHFLSNKYGGGDEE